MIVGFAFAISVLVWPVVTASGVIDLVSSRGCKPRGKSAHRFDDSPVHPHDPTGASRAAPIADAKCPVWGAQRWTGPQW